MGDFFLAESYLLKGATLGDIDSVAVLCVRSEHAEGETLVQVGEASQDILIILEGRVQAIATDGTVLDSLKPGSMIGEIAFLDGKPRTASLVAETACKVAKIPAERLKKIIQENPALAIILYRNIALALCERVRKANEHIQSLSDE